MENRSGFPESKSELNQKQFFFKFIESEAKMIFLKISFFNLN